jgi:two-component system nitrate/nitrite response regulator NarL
MVPRLLNEFATLSEETPAEILSEDEKKNVAVEQDEVAKSKEVEDAEISLLTPRESEVLELVAQGLSNKEIAGKLVISVNTVRSHLRFILDKLHMNNRVQAALWYQKKK